MSEPCDLSAVEARRLIGQKRLSPVELLDSCLARIEAVNPAVNAIVAIDPERAREAARAAEATVMRGERLGRLHGLPVAVKDLVETEGLRTTFGSPIFKEHVPAADEGLVRRLKAAGANIFAKTNTPEFGAGGNSTNPVYGPTGNPYDPARIAGGSSGGSAAALALRMVPLATGSDTGGSLRTPAGFCGIACLRPSQGVIPSDRRRLGWTTYGVAGPMGRSIEDCGLYLAATAGFDTCDPMSAPLDPAGFAAIPEVDLSSLRVAWSEDLGCAPVDSGLRATLRSRMARIGPAFAACAEDTPDFGESDRAFWFIRGTLFLSGFAEHYEKRRDMLGPNVTSNVEAALKMTAAEIAWAHAEQTRIYRRVHEWLKATDILICPAVSVPAFPVEQLYPKEIDGKPLETYMRWLAITYALTLSGTSIAVIPCGRDPTGLPFGIQIVGPRGADLFVLGVARALERLFAADPDLAPPRPDLEALAGRQMTGARHP